MKRITANAIIDIGLLITFIPTILTGLILFLILPEGRRGGGWAAFLGISRNQWVDIHNYCGLVFCALLVLHIILHWNFYRNIRRHLAAKDTDTGEASQHQ